VLGKLYRYVDAFVTDSALGQVYPAPLDIILSSQDVVQPDVVYIATANPNCQLGDEDKWVGVPDLCVEILSSNVRHDRLTKRALYEQFGVKEYWIVDPVGRYIEIHSLQENKLVLVALYQDGDTLESPLLPSLKIDLNQVFPKG
jgi:Uma2 family endonuclease